MTDRFEVHMATEALSEEGDKIRFNILSQPCEVRVKPIEKCCSECSFWEGKFRDTTCCQVSQKKDAEIRGFRKVICARQIM